MKFSHLKLVFEFYHIIKVVIYHGDSRRLGVKMLNIDYFINITFYRVRTRLYLQRRKIDLYRSQPIRPSARSARANPWLSRCTARGTPQRRLGAPP